MSESYECKYCRSKTVKMVEEGRLPDDMDYKIVCLNCGEIDFTDLVDVNNRTMLYENEYVVKKERENKNGP